MAMKNLSFWRDGEMSRENQISLFDAGKDRKPLTSEDREEAKRLSQELAPLC